MYTAAYKYDHISQFTISPPLDRINKSSKQTWNFPVWLIHGENTE